MVPNFNTRVYTLIVLFERYITYILFKKRCGGAWTIFIAYSEHMEFVWEELKFKRLTYALRTIYGSLKDNLNKVRSIYVQ
jgi:hypothetical protein